MTKKETLDFVQSQIGYSFINPDLLEQAFTRRSYTEEKGGENNEVLEFIGDKVLDFIVVKSLSEKYGGFEKEEQNPLGITHSGKFISELNESKLSEIKARLVNKNALASRINALGITDFALETLLKMSKSDITNGIINQPSVKEDLFEAILGAVALDCNWDLEELQNTVDIMLDSDNGIDTEEINYVQNIQQWVAKDSGTVPYYIFKKASYQASWYEHFGGISQHFDILDPEKNQVEHWCFLHIADRLPDFRGFGRNKSEARKEACKVAYDFLKEKGLLPTIRDEIESPNKNDAIGQLEILARRGYFSIPAYDFSEKYDCNGNPIWLCECSIEEVDSCFSFESSSKKTAKKEAAFAMLEFVLN